MKLISHWPVLVVMWAATACGNSATATSGDDAAAADATGSDVAAVDVQFCTGKTSYLYDPHTALTTFPDDWFTVDDPTTPTGVHVHFDPATMPWIQATQGQFASVYTDLSTLDGWGITAGVILRFSGPLQADLPSGDTSVQSDALAIWDLDAKPPVKVPFETKLTDNGNTLILWPMRPLAEQHRHGVIATTQLTDAQGACIAPSLELQALLAGQSADAAVVRLAPRYQALLQAAKVSPAQVAAAVVFTSQTTTAASVAIAADVKTRSYAWKTAPVCVPDTLYRVCDGVFSVGDYRNGRVVVGSTPQSWGDMPVRIWLPLEQTSTVPTMVFGHGLGSDRTQGQDLAEVAAPVNLATVAIDAVGHGDHPGPKQTSKIFQIFAFFGIDPINQTLDGLQLRDNWRQSTYDKLQLLRLLAANPDVDGDGKPDLDMSKIMYVGVSLGGIMGPEFLALSPEIQMACLAVPGGRVSSIISDSGEFSPLVPMMQPAGTTDGDVARFFPVLQTLIDPGDSCAYGPHVLANRLPGQGDKGPNVLFQMVMNDQYVPNVANRALARAMNIPQMAPVLQPVGLVPAAPKAPFADNLAPGQTAALFQYDRVTTSPGAAPVPAEHSNEPKCQEALLQDLHFLTTWLQTGKAEILDPYAVLGTPKLP